MESIKKNFNEMAEAMAESIGYRRKRLEKNYPLDVQMKNAIML